jgi:hypothetical protein
VHLTVNNENATMMILTVSWSIRLRLSISTAILLIAAIAPSLALYATSFGFAPALRLATATPALVAVLGWWSLAAALPVLWIGDVRQTPPRVLLLRFAIGNGFLGILASAGSRLQVAILLGSVVLVATFGWCTTVLMASGPQRDRIERVMARVYSYVIQLALTVALFLATLLPLGWLS